MLLSVEQAQRWSQESEIGVYTLVDIGSEGSLELIVEKDFACLDRSDADNQDTFANPLMGSVC